MTAYEFQRWKLSPQQHNGNREENDQTFITRNLSSGKHQPLIRIRTVSIYNSHLQVSPLICAFSATVPIRGFSSFLELGF
ncbi:hypothetical protein LWI29_011627 [Acer saccharum]|uniref:Uncharacterized protein n=1 Tax=Acer saccharum TaxID=4024 RepID=A0AA39TEK7_ACESA|nr:hypothetical protein LWI29_011627 [Acer saccharum]